MTDPILSDSAFSSAKRALDGLSMRRDLIGQNIANIDTPGYRSREVDFETLLNRSMGSAPRMALASTRSGHLQTPEADSTVYQIRQRSGGTVRADGNNVDIDQELASLTETGIRYEALSSVVSKKINLLKTIAK